MRTKSVERIDLSTSTRTPDCDQIVDEAPLRIQARGHQVAVVMRTPGADLELVRGLLHAEGGAGLAAHALRQIEPDCVEVDVGPGELQSRSLLASAACGVCGRVAIAALEGRVPPASSDLVVEAAVIARLPESLRAAQAVFAATGGLHAAGLFDPSGTAAVVREDVGRHNALDKVIGWAIDRGVLPLARSVVVLSGRIGYELIEKAVLAGAPIVVAVSAPSALAVDVAERFGVALCGFVRGDRMNVYSHAWRISGP